MPTDSRSPVVVRGLTDADWVAVRRIYADSVATRNATFETAVRTAPELDAAWLPGQRWVAETDGEVVGWAAISRVSPRACYRGVAETSVYVDPQRWGEGVGLTLVRHQVEAAQRADFWMLQTSIFPENEASLRLHHRAGFRDVGRRERIAQLDGVWRDTILLEHRRLD